LILPIFLLISTLSGLQN